MTVQPHNSLPAASDFLQEMETRIRALRWRDEAAFSCVELFDVADLAQAMRAQILNQDRICVVIYAGQRFIRNSAAGNCIR
ncbi:MAG: hypothetical protein KIT22_02010 [Verrucomicrobiae bacterium]|nr:hypothetical protein [Verrucomicrobiae bacterium]